MKPFRIDDGLRTILDGSGRQWSLEKKKKHLALCIEGRMVVVLHHGAHGGPKRTNRYKQNTEATVRRFLRNGSTR